MFFPPVELLFILQNPAPTTLLHCASDILSQHWGLPSNQALSPQGWECLCAGSPTLGTPQRLTLGKTPFDPQHCSGQYLPPSVVITHPSSDSQSIQLTSVLSVFEGRTLGVSWVLSADAGRRQTRGLGEDLEPDRPGFKSWLCYSL